MRRAIVARSNNQSAVALAQLQKLYPLLASLGVSAGTKPTAASVAIATMHTPVGGPHRDGCPVSQKHFPLIAVQDERTFMAKPCPLCLKQRVNFLASEVFCQDFEQQCSHGGGEATEKVPAALEEEISQHFHTFPAFEEEFVLFASNAMTPGRTWLVYRERSGRGKLSLVNLPANQLPFAFGLWPLAVVNMTEEALCESLSKLEEENTSEVVEYPSWSRAARNPAGRVAAVPAGSLCPRPVNNLDTVRERTTRSALAVMNWHFVHNQLKDAKTYFGSEARSAAQLARRKATEESVTKEALKNIRDSGTVVVTTKGMDQEEAKKSDAALLSQMSKSTTNTPQTHSKEKSTTSAPAAASKPMHEAAHDSAVAQTEAPEAGATEVAPVSAPSSTEPIKSQLGDGTWEYRYPNGDVTLVIPDGTQVFRTAGVTTTVYTNGNTLYEYANKSSILDRADGVRVTTYPNGTTKEEQIGGAR